LANFLPANFFTFTLLNTNNHLTMKRLPVFFILIIVFISTISLAQSWKNTCILSPEDKQIAVEKLKQFECKSYLSIPDLVVEIGLSFLETPYLAATLENGPEEKMVINLRELDCTTFAENCLALARTVKLGKTDFISFVNELERLRYRDGIRNQYPSRLHYFSEWIHNNHKKGIISESPNRQGEKSSKVINFMSSHPASYPVLKARPEMIPIIAEQEKALTKTGFMYFPKGDLLKLGKQLQHGDIIALTSTIDGIDVNHVGIIVSKVGQFRLLHASQGGKKVVLSDGPVTDFIKPESKNSGIVIARPVFDNAPIGQ
jgi:hypothetical protein